MPSEANSTCSSSSPVFCCSSGIVGTAGAAAEVEGEAAGEPVVLSPASPAPGKPHKALGPVNHRRWCRGDRNLGDTGLFVFVKKHRAF